MRIEDINPDAELFAVYQRLAEKLREHEKTMDVLITVEQACASPEKNLELLKRLAGLETE